MLEVRSSISGWRYKVFLSISSFSCKTQAKSLKNGLSVEIFCFIDYRGKEAFKRGNAISKIIFNEYSFISSGANLRCFASPILVKSHVWQITMYFRVKVGKFACWAEFYARFSVKVKGVTLCTLRINSFLGSIRLLEYVIRVWNQLHHFCMQISLFELSERKEKRKF